MEPTESTTGTTIDTTTNELILDVLVKAATAHGVHEAEELGGVYDEDWPAWYAAHITRSLADGGYRIVRTSNGGL
ncbi:hypothetical protein [Agromyces ramosus]|uniref:Trans-2-enoyl-CoA reductase n=1 Tax=Agromyces ramosus TaxID=33879 RepID=A0ABU0RA14_9MICO|nr:hypothetical protein [Agromyces ramosus]MDQ0894893.1 trans-2-enoyl-CoA reductase [Agromyces ramosus]